MLKNHLKRVILGLILGIIGGLLYWRLAPRVYDGMALVFVNAEVESRSNGQETQEVMALLAEGAAQNVISEIDILRSEQTFKAALRDVAGADLNPNLTSDSMEQQLFMMYDVEADKESRVASIDAKAYDPFVARDIANNIVVEYEKAREGSSIQSYSKAIDYLNNQISGSKRKLDDIEDKVTQFKIQHKILDVMKDETSLDEYLTKLRESLQEMQRDKEVMVPQVAATRKEFKGRAKWLVDSIGLTYNPTLEKIEDTLNGQEQSLLGLQIVYTDDNDKVKQLKKDIEGTKVRMAAEKAREFQQRSKSQRLDPVWQKLENELAGNEVAVIALDSRIGVTTKAINDAEAEAKVYPTLEMKQAQMMRDRELIQGQYFQLKHQLDDINMRASSQAKHAETIYPADVNMKVVSPLASKVIPTGAAVGACLMLLLSMAREALRSTVRTSSELAGVLGLPVTATVPALKARDAQKRMRTLAEPTFVPMESFRFMASAAALAVDHHRKVLFTSVGGNVGCSTSASEFAVAASRMGVKTILVDADLQNATVSKAFGVSGKPGIRDILNHTLLPSGEGSLFLPTEHKNLSVLPAGSAEGLGVTDVPSAQLAAVLENLEPYAQLIVIDCPPFDVLADAARFVPFTDESCLVVSAKKTNLQAIMITEKLLERAGAHTISIILTEASGQEEAFGKNYRYAAKAS